MLFEMQPIENYKNYNVYNSYMEMTTIALPKNVKEDIREFGMMGENYSDVIVRLLISARERQLRDFLMSSEGCVSIEDAIEEARKKWPE